MTKKIETSGSSSKFRYLLGASAAALVIGGVTPAMAESEAEDIVVNATSSAAVATTAAVAAIQQDGAAADESRDVVVVTGSRIQRRVDTTVPVTSIGAEEIENRAFTNAIDAIEQLPVLGNGTNAEGADIANNDFSANADILDLGTNRTLTLINGRRFISSNQATVFVPGNSNGVQVDLTLINPALIERTDIVVGSAGSATYGADAVGGVVNIILKDDFEGFEITGQGGFTQELDGGNYRISAIAGKNFFDERLNITAAAEYFDADEVIAGRERLEGRGFGTIINPVPGGVSTLTLPNLTNPWLAPGGVLVNDDDLSGSTNNQIYPNSATNAVSSTLFNDFVTATGQTPFEYGQGAGAGLDPNLFLGTFGNPGSFIRVPNTDVATSAFLPFRAVPLTFGAGGDLVPYNVGDLRPPTPADQNTVTGGDGFPIGGITSVRAAQERISANLLTRFDLTDNIVHKGEFFYANIKNSNQDGVLSNDPADSATSGDASVPIYIDQNPFLSAQALATIADLEAQGLVIPTIGADRVLYLSRSFEDITGPVDEFGESQFFRITQSLEGNFESWGRNFNWDLAFAYGRTEIDAGQDTLLDIEFALATDVVDDGSGNAVCRQQTLGAPEAIDIRNPSLANINTSFPSPVTPTQAQIDACVPLNLVGGVGAPSAAAIDYVTGNNSSNNVAQQYLGAVQFGGELFDLPAGFVLFSSQFEWRKEKNVFTPGPVFGGGLGRNTLGQPSTGDLRFLEGGTELIIPIFSEQNAVPFFERLEFEGAFRFVNRSGSGGPFNVESSATDLVFNAGGRWEPLPGLTFRGSRSRAVRSPSIVELFGAGVTGFSGTFRGNLNPCDVDSIDGGPAGGIRRTNCEAFAAQLGLPANFLDTFQAPGGSAPAAGASNPNLDNEVSNTWTVGVVIQPEFLPGLTIQSDYYALDLNDEIQLISLSSQCFDQAAFPNSVVDGIPVCDAVVIAQESPAGSGNFIVPSVNLITGNPVLPVANPGSPAQDQQPFTSTFAFFNTANLSATELRALNSSIRYDFSLESLFGSGAADWGDLSLVGNVYYLRRLDQSFTGTFLDTNPEAGEDGDPRFDTRLDVIHNVGPLTHSVQWFRTSATANNVLIADPSTQAAAFLLPEFNQFNYNLAYDISENFTARVIVNNIFNNRLDEEAGLSNNPGNGQGDALGRRFTFGLTARF